MQGIFLIIANTIGLYSLLCLIWVVISWIPELQDNVFSRFLNQVCEPFFSIFRFPFMRFGSLDFSPALAFFVLYFVQEFFSALGRSSGMFTAFSIFAALLKIVLAILGAILTIAIIVLVIRLILEITNKAYRSNYCITLDSVFNPVYDFISSFTGIKERKTIIIVSLVAIFLLRVLVSVLTIFL